MVLYTILTESNKFLHFHMLFYMLLGLAALSYLVFWEKSFALQSSYCLRRRLCCDIKFTNSTNKTQFYDRWIIILFNNKDKVLNNRKLDFRTEKT